MASNSAMEPPPHDSPDFSESARNFTRRPVRRGVACRPALAFLVLVSVIAMGLLVSLTGQELAHAAPSTFTVTSTADSGAGSLREAITNAELTADADTIVFDPTVFTTGTLHTITLASTLPTITKPLTITGPGRDVLAISGNDSVRILYVNQGSNTPPGVVVNISDMTLTHGKATASGGGALLLSQAKVTLTRVTLSWNQMIGSPGGGAVYVGSSSLTAVDTIFEDNTSTNRGGAIRSDYGGIGEVNSYVSLQSSILRRNSGSSGGAVYGARRVEVIDSTVTDNTSSGEGGGLKLDYSYSHTITNTIITGNTGASGGGISSGSVWYKGMLTITGSSITNNIATSNDGSGGIQMKSMIFKFVNSTFSNGQYGNCKPTWAVDGTSVVYSNLIDTTGSTISDNSCNQFDRAVLVTSWTAAAAGGSSTLQAISDPPFVVGDTVRFCAPNGCNTTNTKSGTVTAVDTAADTFAVTVPVSLTASSIATGMYGGAWVDLPKIGSVAPTTGSVSGGDAVTITGGGFGSPSASPTPHVAVTFNGVAATSITHVSDSVVTATSPPGSGSATLMVTGNANTLADNSNSMVGAFEYQGASSPSAGDSSAPVSSGSQGWVAARASAPLGVIASVSGDRVDVNWTAPSSSGDYPIDQYIVTSVPAGLSCRSSTTSCSVSGLDRGTEYSFIVTAQTAAGQGDSSLPSAPVSLGQSVIPAEVGAIAGERKGSISITIAREWVRGQVRVVVSGTSSGLDEGTELVAWRGVPDEKMKRAGWSGRIDEAGEFRWVGVPRGPGRIYVETKDGTVRSNSLQVKPRR